MDDSRFCCTDDEPDISIHDYLLHVYKNFEGVDEFTAVVVPWAYICRLQNTDKIILTRGNMHR